MRVAYHRDYVLLDGTDDARYLSALAAHLPGICERYVFATLRSRGIPMVITLAGGYAASPARTANLHAIVFEEAAGSSRAHPC